MPNLHEAERMVNLFTSVGARGFAVTNTDINEQRIWPLSYHRAIGKHWARTEESHFTAGALHHSLAHMLLLAARRKRYTLADGRTVDAGENLIIRPMAEGVTFVQLDDLSTEQLDRVRPAAFLIHATSPGNYQAWLAVDGVTGDANAFIRRVRKAVGGADKSASGATRIAGSENFKEKYSPNFPTVTIVEGAPGRIMTADRLQEMGLLAEPEPVVAPVTDFHATRKTYSGDRSWPDYQRCLAGAPPNGSGTGPDRSLADYTWCKFAAQRGWGIDEIAAELPNVSEKARERIRNRDPGYVTETAKNGAAAAARGPRRSRA